MASRLNPFFRSLTLFLGRSTGGAILGSVGGLLLVAAVRNWGVQGGAVVSNNYAVGSIIGAINGLALGVGYATLAACAWDWRKPAEL